MSEIVFNALLGFFGVVVTTLGAIAVAKLNAQMKTTKQEVSVVKDHVQNSHINPQTGEAYNLRDNIDDNQREILARLDYVVRQQSGMQKDIGRLGESDLQRRGEMRDTRNDVTQLRRDLGAHIEKAAERVDELEQTINPKRERGN